jgi:hypothetical protein
MILDKGSEEESTEESEVAESQGNDEESIAAAVATLTSLSAVGTLFLLSVHIFASLC